jgi:hypothetical protein
MLYIAWVKKSIHQTLIGIYQILKTHYMKKFLISTHGFDMGIGGLKVLHKLCHLLNERGHDAYLIPLDFSQPFSVYEGYNT